MILAPIAQPASVNPMTIPQNNPQNQEKGQGHSAVVIHSALDTVPHYSHIMSWSFCDLQRIPDTIMLWSVMTEPREADYKYLLLFSFS